MKIKITLLSVLLTCSFSLFTFSSFAQYTKLFDFNGTNGKYPTGTLISDSTYLYGVANGGANNDGVIFKIKKDGSGFTDLLDFNNANGNTPTGSLYSDGTYLYGTADGGPGGDGLIFKIKKDGSGYIDIFDFSGTNGSTPNGSLISDGTYLYGMTNYGGANGDGVVFKIKPDGTGYADLLDFNGQNGQYPYGSLIYDGTYLYGMTQAGGSAGGSGIGVVFKIKPDGTGDTVLSRFNGILNASPYGSLFSDGTFLYGMTYSGGANYNGNNGDGSIFKIKQDGTGYANLLSFNGTNGENPYGSFISDGAFLYGMATGGGANGTGDIFKIKTDGTGFTDMLDFNSTNGADPYGNLLLDGTSLYGMAEKGGTSDDGVIFRLDLPTGIAEQSSSQAFHLYPNPSTGIFTISTDERNAELKVMNVLGQEVFSEKLQQNNSTFNLSSQPAGVYLLRIYSPHGISSKKLIIQK